MENNIRILVKCVAIAAMLANGAFTLTAQNDYYSGHNTITGNTITYVIKHGYSNLSLHDIKDATYGKIAHYNKTGELISIPYEYQMDVQEEDLIRMIKQSFSAADIQKYSKSQENIWIILRINPDSGRVIGLAYWLNHKKDKVLLGIPVNKFEDLEKRIRAGYVQKVMPPLDISHFETAFAFKFSELLP